MSKKSKHITKELDYFIQHASYMEMLDSIPFDQLYKFHLLKWSNNCLAEINKNILNLDKDKQPPYLELVKNKINANLQFAIDNNFLDDYLEKYNLNIIDFPFFSNHQVNSLLSENFTSLDGHKDEAHYKHKFIVKRMQSDFYRYAIFIETNKIFDLIKKYEDHSVPNDIIFKSSDSYKIFTELLKFLNISDGSKRGNPAKLNAIWQTFPSRKAIFKASITKKEYLDYLNSIFDSSFTTKSLSDGSVHERIIQNWIKEQHS